MDDNEVRGVVKNGQVVLDKPLNVPDGTEVFVEVLVPREPQLTMTDEEFQEFTEYFTGKKDRSGFDEFMNRVQASQTGRENLRRAS